MSKVKIYSVDQDGRWYLKMMVAVDNYPLHQQHFWVVYAVNYYKRKEICAGLYILNWCYVLYYRLRRLSVHLITLNHRMYWTTGSK